MTRLLDIGYFLEDIGQERLISALAERVASSLSIEASHHVHNATGGRGSVMSELRRYLSDARHDRVPVHPVLVVAIDGNCSGYQGKKQQIDDIRGRTAYPGTVVYAIPDPHVECWYLADLEAFSQAVAGSRPKALSQTKCKRDYYKRTLLEAFLTAGFRPQLGGAEYARDIVARMDLTRAGRSDRALNHFLNDLRSALRQFSDVA